MRSPNKNQIAERITDEQIALFFATFVRREKPFFVQQRNGTYRRIDRALNTGHVRAHLTGSVTLALLPGEDSMTSFAVVDIDRASPDAVVPVWHQCDALGIDALTVYSGRKGFHVLAFFKEPVSLALAQDIVRYLAGTNEVWPRQRVIRLGACGNAIKAPFGMHRVTGNWCVAVNRGFETINDPWPVLHAIRRVDAVAALAEINKKRGNVASVGGHVVPELPCHVRPCLNREWRNGTERGKRNEVGFALAAEFRRVGLVEVEALDRLEYWNRQCCPPVSLRELRSLCRSAYAAPQPYVFGCSPHGALRRLVGCTGDGECFVGSPSVQVDVAGKPGTREGNPVGSENSQLELGWN